MEFLMNVASDPISATSVRIRSNKAFWSKFDLILAKIAATSFLLCGSRFLEFIPNGDLIRSLLIVFQILIALYGILSSLLRANIFVSFLSFILMISITLSSYNFSIVSQTAFVPISGGDYFAIGLVALFHNIVMDGNTEKFLQYIYRISIAYVFLYIAIWFLIRYNVIHPLDYSKIVRESGGGDDRGLRLAFMVSFVIYAACVSAAMLVGRINFLNIFNFLAVAICLALSGSRLISAITGLVLFLYFIVRNSKLISKAIFAIFIVQIFFVSFLIINHSFNPFDFLTSEGDRVADVSAWARWKALTVLNELIPNTWLFGIGIPNGPAGYEPVTHLNFVFPEDLGLFGVFVKFGIFGYLFYLAICLNSFSMNKYVFFERPLLQIGFRISLAIFCLYSLMSPIFFSSGIIFSGIILAFVLSSRGNREFYLPRSR